MAKSKPASSANGVPLSEAVMTLTEAATFLRVAESVVAAEAEAGHLPGRKLGGEWRFASPALMAWLSQPEQTLRPKSGAEIVEQIRRINRDAGFTDSQSEAEAFIDEMSKLRKHGPAGNDP